MALLAAFVPVALALALSSETQSRPASMQEAIDQAIETIGLPPATPQDSPRKRWSWRRAALWHGALIAGDLLVTEVHLSRNPTAWEGNPLPGMDTRRGRVAWLSGEAVAAVAVDALAHRLFGRKGSRAWRATTGLGEGGAICGHLDAHCPINTGRLLSALHLERPKPSVLHAVIKTKRLPDTPRDKGDKIPSHTCRGGGPCELPALVSP